MGGDVEDTEQARRRGEKSRVMIPDVGAAKYWYVDPSVRGQGQFDPMLNLGYRDEGDSDEREQAWRDAMDALSRIGVAEPWQQQQPSF